MTSNGKLRSAEWFGATGRSGMIYRSWMRNQGFTPEVFDGRPVIGIATTWSELAPCNAHLHRVAESVKRGVWQAGGFPLEFPAMALGETLLRPIRQTVARGAWSACDGPTCSSRAAASSTTTA